MVYVLPTSNVTVETSSTELKLEKDSTKGIQRLLRIPLVRPSQLLASRTYYVQVQIGLRAASASSRPMLYLSDNHNAVGFVLPSSLQDTTAVCCGTEGSEAFPNGLTQARKVGETTTEGPIKSFGSRNNTNNNDLSSSGGGDDDDVNDDRRRRDTGDKDNINDDDDSIIGGADDGDVGTLGNVSRERRDDSDDSDSDSDDSDSDNSENNSDESDGENDANIEGVTPFPQKATSDDSGTPSAPTNPSNTAQSYTTRLLFKPRNSWGSCTAVQTTGATGTVMFSLPINPDNGLFLDMYLDSQEQQISITYMLITLVLETNPIMI